MDYYRVALFLAAYTTDGFRRSLRASPQATLLKCGFDPGEAAQLAASLSKHSHIGDTHEVARIQFTFQKITATSADGSKSQPDDWSSNC